MANFPTSLPSSSPSTHGVVLDEVIALAQWTAVQPEYVSGNWYQSPHIFTQTNHGPNTTLVLSPHWFPLGTQIVQLGEWVNTGGAAGAVRRLGIYADDGNGYPGSLILDAGTYDATTTGFKSVTAFTAVNVGGLTWIGGASQVATGTVVVGASNNIPGITGGSGTPPTGSNTMTGYQETGVTGALPSTFTATRSVQNGAPKMYVKIA